MKIIKKTLINLTVLFCASSSLYLLNIKKAFAAEEIILQYGIFTSSVTVDELENFALKGTFDSALGDLNKQGSVTNFLIQRSLIQEIPVSLVTLDKALNNIIGEILLDRIGQVIKMPSGDQNAKALRASIILAAEDNKISMLEIIKKYPSKEVIIDTEKLIKLRSEITDLANFMQSLFLNSYLKERK